MPDKIGVKVWYFESKEDGKFRLIVKGENYVTKEDKITGSTSDETDFNVKIDDKPKKVANDSA